MTSTFSPSRPDGSPNRPDDAPSRPDASLNRPDDPPIPEATVIHHAWGSRPQPALARGAVRALVAAAAAHELCPELGLRDPVAARLLTDLGYGSARFTKGELRCSAFRSSVVDHLVHHFFLRHPDAIGVGLWPCLGTRSHRVDQSWLDVDVPELAELRRVLLPARAGWVQHAACMCDGAGLGAAVAGGSSKRLFVLDESALPLRSQELVLILDTISRHALAGSELLLVLDAPAIVTTARPALELGIGAAGAGAMVKYPRLHHVDGSGYDAQLHSSLTGLNAVSALQGGVSAPALLHLRVV